VLEGASIVCFANDWGGDPTSKTHIMRILARRNRVLWVNSVGMRRPTASRRDLRRIGAKLRRTLEGCVEVEPNLFVANPLVLPLPGWPAVNRLNARILSVWLRHLCRRHGLERPILWTYPPHMSRLIGRLDERLVVYHCVDQYSEFAGVAREALIDMEHDLLRRSDVVLTSSQQLCDERRRLNPNTHFVPHGVDVAHFSRALERTTEVPADVRDVASPVVGFFGALAEWVDLPLIRAVATARPDWSIVLVGKATTDLAVVRGLPNVHVLGQKPYATLPGYCRAFDVGIIPFLRNELTVRANPLKLREYLAAGLPVVATPLPEVARYDGLIRLADGCDGFVAAIAATLGERSEALAHHRVEAMRSEAWDARVETISDIVARRLATAAPQHTAA